MRAPLVSGFCNQSNPDDSHARCAGCGCTCHTNLAPVLIERPDAVAGVQQSVERLAAEQDALLEACTDPEARDMAELLWHVQQARINLQAVERAVEETCAKAMLGDQVQAGDLFVERHRSTTRKSWDHEDWQRDVRAKVLQAHGLKGAQGVLDAEGEVLPASVLFDALAAVQSAHGAAAPKTTSLRGLGLDARDYCESSPGNWHVRVQRRVETETGGGQDDAA